MSETNPTVEALRAALSLVAAAVLREGKHRSHYLGMPEPPHEITLVIRSSDGGFIVLYDEEEKAILQTPDTELWIEGDGDGPERFTIGTLADRLGINRLPVREGGGQPVPLLLS